jgi:hypothetical protein
VSEKKRGRPKTKEVNFWEEKYYRLSNMRDNQAIRKTVEERLHKVYAEVFELANGRKPNQRDMITLNRAVNDILERI